MQGPEQQATGIAAGYQAVYMYAIVLSPETRSDNSGT